MHQHLIKISSLSFIFGLLTLLAQFGLLYFLENPFPAAAVSLILIVLFCHFILESSFAFNLCFTYILFIEIGGIALSLAAYYEVFGSLFPFTAAMGMLCVLNWIVPLLYFILRYMLDKGPRFLGFPVFFIQMAVLFWLVFGAWFIYQIFFIKLSFPLPAGNTSPADTATNFIPFMTIASYVEAKIYEGLSLAPMLLYSFQYVVLFIPFGFYLHALFRRKLLPLRLFLMLFIPFLIELLQYFTGRPQSDMDDLVLGVLGMIVGALAYDLLNAVCMRISDEEFLQKRSRTTMYHMWRH